tara:strand:+ start:95670 stop:96584 length:915 start_codon:yes stop_codon:yes gene_type:complete
MTESAIELFNIKKDYPGVVALDNISFKVKKGSVHGLLGPNGAGKSTTMKLIVGLIPPTSGQITVSSSIGILPEFPPLYGSMRVKDYLSFVYDIKTIHKKDSNKKSYVEQAIVKCGLESVSHRLIENLSRGFKQRVGIAQALVSNPDIVILDEPTVGLDPEAIEDIRNLILELKKDHTVMLSTHHLHEANVLCDDVTIIHQGKVIQSGSIEELQKQFQTGFVVVVLLEGWSVEKEKNFLFEYQGSKIRVIENVGDSTKLEISHIDKDYLKLWTKWLSTNCDLLSFEKINLTLEDIFKSAIKGEKR